MRIVQVNTYPISLKLKEPFVIGNVTNYRMYYTIIEVKTDEGITGWGEVIPAWEVTGETQQGVRSVVNLFSNKDLLGESLLNKKINSLDDLFSLYNTFLNPITSPQYIEGNPSTKCGIECALFDVIGKFQGKSVLDLLGGKRQAISLPLVLGIETVEKTLEKVMGGIAAGYTTIKLKVGKKKVGKLDNYERDIEVINRSLECARSEGGNVKICADANQGYRDAETAIRIINNFNTDLSWLEQPVVASDSEGLKEVRRKSSIPIMADEAVHSYHDARRLLELGAADYINIKLMKSGGIIGAKRIADLAKTYGVPCQIGSMLESSLGTVMGATAYLALDNIFANELVGMELLSQNIGRGVTLEGNQLLLPSGKGFGVTYEPKDFSKYRTRENRERGGRSEVNKNEK